MRSKILNKVVFATSLVFTSSLLGCGSDGNVSASSSDISAVGQSATGASLSCTSNPGHNAWQTYGGAAFLAVNNSIITNVTNELTAHGTTNLGTSFGTAGTGTLPANQDNLATFTGSLAAFLVYLYGGPTYLNFQVGTSSAAGNPPIIITFAGPQGMQAAHTGFAITSAQYTYFVTNIVVPALTSNGVPSGDISSCFAPPLLDPTFQASIVGQ